MSIAKELDKTFEWNEIFNMTWKNPQPLLNVLSPTSKQEYEHEHEKMLCSWITNKSTAWQTKYRAFGSDNFGDASLLSTASNDDLYEYAQRFNDNLTKKIEVLTIAAEREHIRSCTQLGKLYESKDVNSAFKWYLRAADQGDATSQFCVGIYYYTQDSNGVPRNKELSIVYFTRAAEQDHKNSQYNLGHLYLCDKKYDMAIKWLTKAADKHDADAIYLLGRIHEKGYGVEKNEKLAITFYTRAANLGDVDAQYVLGCHYQKSNNMQAALPFFTAAANNACGKSQYELAVYYMTAADVEDHKKIAFEWCMRSAETNNYAVAQNELGIWYATGFYHAPNAERSQYWYLRAAMQDLAIAQYNVAIGYLRSQKFPEMMHWLNLAASQHEPDAEFELGQCFELGNRGVGVNMAIAKKMYVKAAAHGHVAAKAKLASL